MTRHHYYLQIKITNVLKAKGDVDNTLQSCHMKQPSLSNPSFPTSLRPTVISTAIRDGIRDRRHHRMRTPFNYLSLKRGKAQSMEIHCQL